MGSGSAAAGRPRTVPSSKPRSSPSPDPTTGPKGQWTRRPGNRARLGSRARDPREAGARCWDALIALAQHALTTGRVPETHGTPARLLITLDHHTLLQQLDANGIETRVKRVGTTGDGVDLPPGTLRRLACDAELLPAILNSHRRGPRRRPDPTPGHPRPMDRPGRPRPALHLPHLHPTTSHVPRPPPHPLGRRRRHLTGQPRPACAAAITASSTTPPGRYASTPTTDNPNSNPHPNPASPPNGSAIDPDSTRPTSQRGSRRRGTTPSSVVRTTARAAPATSPAVQLMTTEKIRVDVPTMSTATAAITTWLST